jgi:hypothetical protein
MIENESEKTLAEKATASVLARQDRMLNLASQQARTLKKKLRFLDVFADQAHGMITVACHLAGIKSRKTFYNWMETDPDFKQAIENMDQVHYDFVHDLYMANIARGNTSLIRHYLDHRHPAYKRRKSHGDIEWLKKHGYPTDLPDWFHVPKNNSDV